MGNMTQPVVWTVGHSTRTTDELLAILDAGHVKLLADVRRFPGSRVRYVAANLLAPPAAWARAFDIVIEINTLQALPGDVRPAAVERVADFVAPGGTLIVICRGREEGELVDGPPWPLVRRELSAFGDDGLHPVSFDDVRDETDDAPVRRFVAVFRRV